MKTSFNKRLDALVERFDSASAAGVAQTVEGLKAAGMVSEETLIELVMQPTTPKSIDSTLAGYCPVSRPNEQRAPSSPRCATTIPMYVPELR